GRSILARFAFFSYLEIAICIIALSFFLVTRRASPFLAAILFTGGAFSLALGVFLLPLTIPGVFVLVGLLGFTPFFTSYVFMRNARRCWSQSFRDRLPAAILAATLTFLVPAGIQFEMLRITNRAVAMLQSGTDQEATRASHMLKLVHVAINTDKIALAYERTQDQKQRERLARAFQEITGEKIEDRMIELGD
ncbi:MAG TPA: hypothetical protein VG759_05440, partial [Candidatus Angelobacter sp.]|nr:hypothetical protein [Candidatus Angelobacter sp.]